MKAIETTATIDESGKFILDKSLGQHKPQQVRLKNSDTRKGKSGGYRVICYLKTSHAIILVTIYSKSDFSDVSSETIKEAIAQYEQESQMIDNSAFEEEF